MKDEKIKIGKKGTAKKVAEFLKEVRKRPISNEVFEIVDKSYEKNKEQKPNRKIAKQISDLEK